MIYILCVGMRAMELFFAFWGHFDNNPNDNNDVWFPILIRNIALELGLTKDKLIDIFKALGGAELMCDGCHPNEAG